MPFIWLLNGCNPLGEPVNEILSPNHYYSPSKDDIIYTRDGNWLKYGKQPMHADAESFEVFNEYFGRDKNAVYFRAGQIQHPSLDVSSFHTTSDAYTVLTGLDKNHVYFLELYGDNNEKVRVRIVEHADPKTYMGVNYEWSKDRSNYFYKGTKFNVAYDSFKILNDYFVRDSSQVYVSVNQNITLLECDQASFRLFQKTYHGMDNQSIYWLPSMVPGKYPPIAIPYTRIEQVSYLNNFYLRVGDKVYYDGKVMSGVTTDNFSIVNDAYAKDEKHVYYKGTIIPDADVATFELRDFVVIDKNGRYEEGKIVGPVPVN